MSKKSKPQSRWNAGRMRYDEATRDYIIAHYKESYPWYKGGRCSQRRKVA